MPVEPVAVYSGSMGSSWGRRGHWDRQCTRGSCTHVLCDGARGATWPLGNPSGPITAGSCRVASPTCEWLRRSQKPLWLPKRRGNGLPIGRLSWVASHNEQAVQGTALELARAPPCCGSFETAWHNNGQRKRRRRKRSRRGSKRQLSPWGPRMR